MARAKISKALKQQVNDRARGCCEYCRSQRQFSPSGFEIEHTTPLSRGGSDTLEMLPLTAIGRATIALLQTNRASVVNLRRVLRLQGLHPPN
jgi:hypothetical protein